ncbi:MAG: 7-alpha-hydroxysteroid dehydrogenase [Candidatus Binatia bacterium]|nr:MAG: 7-alpha-hydroxysteroid dehydrogenase [Candidatus Binatia bacterium]
MILERFRIPGRVAVVTGGGRGIGAGIARAFAEAGADVAVGARTAKEVEAVAEEVRSLGRRGLAVVCDVTKREDIENLVETTVRELGRIDIVVNNAGGTPPQEALYTSERMFEEAFHFNVTSAFLLTRLAVPHMLREGGGAVVNISSAAGRVPIPGFVAYGTAKAALSFMTRILAQEFAPKIRVNAIAVGAVETSALAPFLTPEIREKMEALTPMARIGTVEDIAAAALYLASPASSWVTGKVFEVDGGAEGSTWPFPPPRL